MFGTKHQHRRSSKPQSELPSRTIRPVEMPPRVDKGEHEENAVVLGAREPDDGRYTTLSRETYQHGHQKPKPGEAAPKIPAKKAIDDEKNARVRFMQNKNFPFGFEGVELPMISEARGAQQSSVEMRREQQQRTPTPTFSSMPRRVSPEPAAECQSEAKAHLDRMRSSHVFDGPVTTERAAGNREHQSTQRSSYMNHDAGKLAHQRAEVSRLRAIQTATNWTGGNYGSKNWKSTKETEHTGAMTKPAEMSTQNLRTTVTIGNSTTNVKDMLRSLKQVDFVPHRASVTPTPSFTAHEDHLVLGYRAPDIDSTNRTSYTPTVYVAPRDPAAHKVPTFRAGR